ncbi:hypothetical protein KKE26_01660 [bacterium]|nr:hypothetical protein [bacterium]MBU1752980.1 hypothetical protein [bacterium]
MGVRVAAVLICPLPVISKSVLSVHGIAIAVNVAVNSFTLAMTVYVPIFVPRVKIVEVVPLTLVMVVVANKVIAQ